MVIKYEMFTIPSINPQRHAREDLGLTHLREVFTVKTQTTSRHREEPYTDNTMTRS